MTEKSKVWQSTAPLRMSEWWESKFAPLFGTVYATCLILQIPFFNLFPFIAFLLVALLPGAAFVSVINDLTDLDEDKIAGKTNRLEGKSKIFAIGLIAICLGFGILISFFLSKFTLILYLCAWIVFTCYSVPPIRLKKRGIWGVLADTLGANVFPQLFAVSLFMDWFGKELDFRWFGLIGIWSFCLGLRGIISHQLSDKENDKVAGVKTFVQNFDSSRIIKFSNLIIFPIEVIVLIFLLCFSTNWFGFLFLGIYSIWVLLLCSVWGLRLAAVTRKFGEVFLLSDFYFIFFPISFLLTGLLIFSNSFIVIVLHILLFPKNLCTFLKQMPGLVSDSWLAIREFLFGY